MNKKEKRQLMIICGIVVFMQIKWFISAINAPQRTMPSQAYNFFLILSSSGLIFGIVMLIAFLKNAPNYFYKNVPNLKEKFSLEYLKYSFLAASVFAIIGSLPFFIQVFILKSIIIG